MDGAGRASAPSLITTRPRSSAGLAVLVLGVGLLDLPLSYAIACRVGA